jgi:hypothetical protein
LVLLTLFLFIVDMFWGFVLSRELVNILPTEAEQEAAVTNKNAEPVKDW